MSTDLAPIGTLLRDWRGRRRLSQLDLALEAGVSARHLSFVETGRSRASRAMVLHLAERLDVPLRDRNQLLLAAGYAPEYEERTFDAPAMGPAREALQRVLDGHEPYPALVVDRWWNLVAANPSLGLFTEDVAPELLEPPVNVLRLTLHPDGMARRIANLAEVRAYVLDGLRRQVVLTADPALSALYAEISAFPAPETLEVHDTASQVAVPVRLRTERGELAFFSTIATFGTAVDVTLAELSIEAFFPADAATAAALRALADARVSAASPPAAPA